MFLNSTAKTSNRTSYVVLLYCILTFKENLSEILAFLLIRQCCSLHKYATVFLETILSEDIVRNPFCVSIWERLPF